MYKNFCRNLKNYLEANKNGSNEEFRLKIIKPFKILADIELYNKLSNKNLTEIKEVNNLVYEINKEKKTYHQFKQFSWDLWLADFKAIKSEKFDKEIVNEQLKILKLLLGTQYW